MDWAENVVKCVHLHVIYVNVSETNEQPDSDHLLLYSSM